MAPCPAWIATAFCARSAQSRLEQSQSVRMHGRGIHHVPHDGVGARLRIALKVGMPFTTAPHRNDQRTCGTFRSLFSSSIEPCATGVPGLAVASGNAPGVGGSRCYPCVRYPVSRLLDPFSPSGSFPLVAQAQISGARAVRLQRNGIFRSRKSRRLTDSEACPGRLRRHPGLSGKAH